MYISLITVLILLVILGSRSRLDKTRAGSIIGRFEKPLCCLIFAAAIASYFNFGKFHGSGPTATRQILHPHDAFHYIMGSKYFHELQYDRLYECAFLALYENGIPPSKLPELYVRRMSDYRLIKGSEILKNPDAYKNRFSYERWKTFKDDVNAFAAYLEKLNLTEHSIYSILEDHGFNPSPLYVAVAKPISSLIPISADTLEYFAVFDFLLLSFLFAVVLLCCDIRIAACIAAMFGFSFSSRYQWIGGSFLRSMFLVSLGLGFILLQRKKASAALFLTFSAILRVFPVFALIGAFISSLWIILKRSSCRESQRKDSALFFVTAAASAVMLIAFTCASTGGLQPLIRWQEKIKIHGSFVSANSIGLPSVIAYSPSYSIDEMINQYARIYGGINFGLESGQEPSISGFIGSKRAEIVADNYLLALLIIIASWIILIMLSRNLDMASCAIFAVAFSYVSGIQFSGYYSSFLCFIPLAFSKVSEQDKYSSLYFATCFFLAAFFLQHVWASYYEALDARSFFESASTIIAIFIALYFRVKAQSSTQGSHDMPQQNSC